MKNKAALIALIFLAASPAWAINKCTIDGKVVYQDAACDANAKKTEEVKTWGAGRATSYSPGTPIKFTQKDIETDQAEEAASLALSIAKASMKDPGSVQARGIRVFSFDALGRTFIMTCGEINARNGFGGYVGFQPFWVYDGTFTQTYDHYLPTSKSVNWTMGGPQSACLVDGVRVQAE